MDVFFPTDDRQEYLLLLSQIGFETRARFLSLVSDEGARNRVRSIINANHHPASRPILVIC